MVVVLDLQVIGSIIVGHSSDRDLAAEVALPEVADDTSTNNSGAANSAHTVFDHVIDDVTVVTNRKFLRSDRIFSGPYVRLNEGGLQGRRNILGRSRINAPIIVVEIHLLAGTKLVASHHHFLAARGIIPIVGPSLASSIGGVALPERSLTINDIFPLFECINSKTFHVISEDTLTGAGGIASGDRGNRFDRIEHIPQLQRILAEHALELLKHSRCQVSQGQAIKAKSTIPCGGGASGITNPFKGDLSHAMTLGIHDAE